MKHAAGDSLSGKRFYITTAISYPNGKPHIGHAYEAIASDAIARFYRLDGWDTHFLTGTDEHGLKMAQTAEKRGITPRQLADENTALFVQMADELSISYDDFIRTTEARHAKGAQALWRAMYDSGDIYRGTYNGWYSVRDEAYYGEEELTINDSGQRISPHGTAVSWVSEQTWFFRLSSYQERLLEFYAKNHEFVRPKERFNEVIRFVEGGLSDLSISRTTFSWGIPVPDDEAHVMYVWVDALANYATAVGLGADDDFVNKGLWPADLHVIGKDIVRFHAVYWPAFLMSARLPLPRRIFAHGFLFNRGEKMSKSAGNVIDPMSLARHFGVDGLRYFLLREVPFGRDGAYSAESIAGRINADLANDFGNLAQRVLSIIHRHCDGKIPAKDELEEVDQIVLGSVDAMVGEVRAAMAEQAPHLALAAIWSRVAEVNRYVASQQPWSVRKENPQRADTILHVASEMLRVFGIMAQAFIPTAANKLLDTLGIAPDKRSIAHVSGEQAEPIAVGAQLLALQPIFPRVTVPE